MLGLVASACGGRSPPHVAPPPASLSPEPEAQPIDVLPTPRYGPPVVAPRVESSCGCHVTDERVRDHRGSPTGFIDGRVLDDTSQPLAGVTIVATSPALVGEQVVITDERGAYLFEQLPPGNYMLTYFYWSDQVFTHSDVIVEAGTTTQERLTHWVVR